MQFDPDVWYPVDIDDETFGNVVLMSLAASKNMQRPFNEADLEERTRIAGTDESKRRTAGTGYEDWVRSARERFGYKTKKKMFRHMVCGDVREKDGILQAAINEHVKIEAWSAALETYTFDRGTTPQILGQSLRNTFDNVFAEDLF